MGDTMKSVILTVAVIAVVFRVDQLRRLVTNQF